MKQIIDPLQAAAMVRPGSAVMMGGFLGVGVPMETLDALCQRGTSQLTVICNDTGFPEAGVGKLVVNRQVVRVMTSHIGTNPATGKQMNEGELQVELVPQGTLAEQIRAAGAGLGGVLTATGLGTVAQEGRKVINVEGQDYILAEPVSADIALLKARKADTAGNLVYRRAARNFNPLMAMAAQLVLAEVEEIVEVGDLDPDEVMTPGIFVDYLVKGGGKNE